MKKWQFSTKLLYWLLIITATLLAAHLILQYLNLHYNEKQGQIFELSNRLDMDDEVSVPTWFSQILLLGIGGLGFLAARFGDTKGKKRVWFFIALAGLFFSADEVAALHELLLQSLHLLVFGLEPTSISTNAWLLAIPIIIAGGAMILLWLYKYLPIRTWLLIMTGGVLFVTGAAGFDLISSGFDKRTFYYQGILTGVEETFELVGSILILYATANYLDIKHKTEMRRLGEALTRTRHGHNVHEEKADNEP